MSSATNDAAAPSAPAFSSIPMVFPSDTVNVELPQLSTASVINAVTVSSVCNDAKSTVLEFDNSVECFYDANEPAPAQNHDKLVSRKEGSFNASFCSKKLCSKNQVASNSEFVTENLLIMEKSPTGTCTMSPQGANLPNLEGETNDSKSALAASTLPTAKISIIFFMITKWGA